MKKLTIIMPFLNEGDEPINTIESIYKTANREDFEIIAIDDVSFDNLYFTRFDKYKEVKYVRNEIRLGVDGCRDIGINLATTPYVLIIDAHMRFKNDNWLNKIVYELEKDPKLLLSTKSTGLDEDNPNNWDVNQTDDKDGDANCGVDIYPYFVPLSDMSNKNIFDARWKRKQLDKGYIYEVPCVMGANYASSVEWLKYIKGFKGLLYWGASEQFISIKTWLAGGSVKVLTNVLIGHLYRVKTAQGFFVDDFYVLYNFLLLSYVLFDDTVTYNFLNFCSSDSRYKIPIKLLNENIVELEKDRRYYKSIFVKDIKYLEEKLDKFIIDGDSANSKISEYNNLINSKKEYVESLDVENNRLNIYKEQLNSIINDTTISDDRKNALVLNIKNRFPVIENEINRIQSIINDITYKLENDFKKYIMIK